MIRYFTAGESHGQALVGIVEGIPAGLSLSAAYINHQLWRRQQGYGRGGRMRIEKDAVEILSGVRFGKTLGSPVALVVRNQDWEHWKQKMAVDGAGRGVEKITIPRPGHADYVGLIKYGYDDIRNTIERASARETAMRVACCTVVRKLLEELGIYIGSHVLSIGRAVYSDRTALEKQLKRLAKARCGAYKIAEEADKSEVRILDRKVAAQAVKTIERAKENGDTLGGIFEMIVTGMPAGVGSYVQFDRRLDGQLCQAVGSIHAVKGVEIGDGFANALKLGSEVHDEIFVDKNGTIYRKTNRAGGLEGGVTNGQWLVLRGAMKPLSTLMQPLRTVDLKTRSPVAARRERSDYCAVPACAVISEAVIAPVIANSFLEKYGGDSMPEIKRRYNKTRRKT
ncbi:MAG: chorismate synthase [Bacteroidota bacterium]